jgi:hypothetical protein
MKLARLSLTGLFLGAIACSSVQTVHNPAQFMSTNPAMVVVIYNDNGEVPIAQPRMKGDTIVGTWAGLGEPIEVPMDQVQRVDAIQKDPKKTTLFIASLIGAAAVTTYGFTRAVHSTGQICDFFRPEDRQCYNSGTSDPDLRVR